MKNTTSYLAFNRGLVSPLALARLDIKRIAMSAEEMTNWMPRALGSMSLRPGTRFMHETADSSACILIPFVFSTTDTALIELTNLKMRVSSGQTDAYFERPAVTTTLTNGTFTSDLTGWTDADETGAASTWVNESGTGTMFLEGTGTSEARRRQEVTVAGGDVGLEHSLVFYVGRGEGFLRIGASAGAGEYINISIAKGWYSIAFTPTANFHIEFASSVNRPTQIYPVSIAQSGTFEIDTPWPMAELQGLTWDQSGDVVFVANGARVQHRLERYGDRSWAVVEYRPKDGPFRTINGSAVSFTPGALQGATTLTASKNFWTDDLVGALFRLESSGQKVDAGVTAADQWSDPIRVTGIGNGRIFEISRSGTWSATVTLQRSIAEPGAWVDVTTYTTNGTVNYDDGLDNQIIYYRIGVKTGGFTSGTVLLSLSYSAGSIRGIARVEEITSPTVAQVDVLTAFGGIDPVRFWWESAWSPKRGYPSAVTFYDGRLWWAGNDRIYGSISDAFDSFDDEEEGDAGPITRSIGSGPVESINWLLPLSQLIVGTQGSEIVAKASNIEEPLTPSAFRLSTVSTQGSRENVPAVRVDSAGIFAQRCGSRVYEILPENGGFTYATRELTSIVPEVGGSGIKRIAVQRQPDTRIYCVRDDGKCAVLVFDPVEEVNCWVLMDTPNGTFQDVAVLPGDIEDKVYFSVQRQFGAQLRTYVERMAPDRFTQGLTECYLSDSSVSYEGLPTSTLSGMTHLVDEDVVVWGDGRFIGTFTVSITGEVTLSENVSIATTGLAYEARFKSTKLGHILRDGRTSLTQRQRLDHVGLVLKDTHVQGLEFGQDFDHLDPLPKVERGSALADAPPDMGYLIPDGGTLVEDGVWLTYEEDTLPLNGTWDTDARLCLKATSPKPCTVLAAIVEHNTNWKG